MAGFNFNEVENFVPQRESSNSFGNGTKIKFLKLEDDGWYANVRFMYGEGETFRGETVHNTAEQGQMPKYVPCLREPGQPLDVCPLCAAGSKVVGQYFMPVYVISIVKNIRGQEEEVPVNDVMLFQRGTTFQGAINAVIRNADGNAIVNTIFRIVRNGKKGAQGTTYTVEKVKTDTTGLSDLPERPQILGSYILPDVDAQKMTEKYINKTSTSSTMGTQPRTVSANTFTGNTVVGGYNQAVPPTQVPVQAPSITGKPKGANVPF